MILLALTAGRAFENFAAPPWPGQVRLAVKYARLTAAESDPGTGFVSVAEEVTARHPADFFLALRTGSVLLERGAGGPTAA